MLIVEGIVLAAAFFSTNMMYAKPNNIYSKMQFNAAKYYMFSTNI